MLLRPSPRAQAQCHLALAALWCGSRIASHHGWWGALAELDRHANLAKVLGGVAAWLAVGLLAILALGLRQASWPLRAATGMALAAMLGGVEGVDAFDVAWLCLATSVACWILTSAEIKSHSTNQATF